MTDAAASRFLVVAGLTTAAGLGLSTALRFPEVLLEDGSFGASLVAANPVAAVASLVGLLLSGVAVVALSRALPTPSHVGTAAGVGWSVCAVSVLILVVLWANAVSAGVAVLAGIAFSSGALAAPVLLAAWTVGLVRRHPGTRVGGVLGALGLLAVSARSLVWALNSRMSAVDGFHLTAAGLTVVALVGYPVWIWWLVRMGLGLRRSGEAPRLAGRRLATGLLAIVFLATYVVTTVVGRPTPHSDAVPSVPSTASTVRYLVMLALADLFALPTNERELIGARQSDDFTKPAVPGYATRRMVDADGVAAENICAEGATDERVALYLPGGGFILPPSNGSRAFAAALSRETGMCVLMAHYRLAPEHPFPAALRDGVTAYRWLRRQGHPASRIVLIGDSAGGNLALTTAVSLRDSGDALPAALVSISPITDFTLSGDTVRTKDDAEALLTEGTREFTVRSYAGATDLRDPLLSPLYADPRGLPPTLLMVGSQEVLLSDSLRMAEKLRDAHVPVRLEVWPGVPHSFNGARKDTMETRLALQHIYTFVRPLLP